MIFVRCIFLDTSRKPRESEIDGQHYHFTARETMEQMIAKNEFYEYAEFGGNLYGTRSSLEEIFDHLLIILRIY